MSETFKVDKQIGKQKFKAKRQYIVEVEFEGEAYDKESFEELIPSELSVKDYDDIGDKSNVITLEYERWWHQSTEKDLTGKTINLDQTKKIGECVPEEYEDEDG